MNADSILVIDDESGIRASLQGILEDEGYEVTLADSGEAGLGRLETSNFGLVLLDIWLPGMSGIDVLKKLQSDRKRVDVVVITASSQEGIEDEAWSLGVIDYLKKPLDAFEVERITSQYLN